MQWSKQGRSSGFDEISERAIPLLWLTLSIVGAAVQGIYVAALYRYAKTKQVSTEFPAGKLLEGVAA
jgi:hypothetical protein